MNGIVDQFANSPKIKEINRLTVSASGTVTVLMTGSVDLMWRAGTNGGNLSEIRLTTSDGTHFWALEAGADTGWIPGNLQGYSYVGISPGDELSLWRLR